MTAKDIVEELARQGFEVDKRFVRLEKPIKELGEVKVPIKLHAEVVVEIGVSVVRA